MTLSRPAQCDDTCTTVCGHDNGLRAVMADVARAHEFDPVGRICSCGVLCGVVCDNLTAGQHLTDALLSDPAVQAAMRRREQQAEQRGYERGRDSVGLGDFLPDPCGDEHRARASHIAETYGDWLACSRRRGHGDDHEHEDSGVTWTARAESIDPNGRRDQ